MATAPMKIYQPSVDLLKAVVRLCVSTHHIVERRTGAVWYCVGLKTLEGRQALALTQPGRSHPMLVNFDRLSDDFEIKMEAPPDEE